MNWNLALPLLNVLLQAWATKHSQQAPPPGAANNASLGGETPRHPRSFVGRTLDNLAQHFSPVNKAATNDPVLQQQLQQQSLINALGGAVSIGAIGTAWYYKHRADQRAAKLKAIEEELTRKKNEVIEMQAYRAFFEQMPNLSQENTRLSVHLGELQKDIKRLNAEHRKIVSEKDEAIQIQNTKLGAHDQEINALNKKKDEEIEAAKKENFERHGAINMMLSRLGDVEDVLNRLEAEVNGDELMPRDVPQPPSRRYAGFQSLQDQYFEGYYQRHPEKKVPAPASASRPRAS